VACSPTPNSLRALVLQLNHEERNVADKTMTRGSMDPRIPQAPLKRSKVWLLPLSEMVNNFTLEHKHQLIY
jgi:hypothetical protein